MAPPVRHPTADACTTIDVVVATFNGWEMTESCLRHLEALRAPAPLLVRPGGERIDSVGLAADPTLAGFPRLQGRPVADASERRPELLGPSGGGGAYRRTAWEDAGGMDERIFLYQEDLDLALRLRQSGWQAAIALDAVGVHLGSATSQRRSIWQRERAGLARGYILRRYGVLRSTVGPRALLTEALVAGGRGDIARPGRTARSPPRLV